MEIRTSTMKKGTGVGVAAVLLQENEERLYPVRYASKKLSPAESKYQIVENECLAVVWLIRRFKLLHVSGWQEIHTPDRPQTPEVPKECCLPE